MGMFFIVVEEGLVLDDAARRPADLRLHHGDLTLSHAGVVARLNGPLAKYSRYYDWPTVIVGYATLRSLMEDIRYGEQATFDLVCDRFRLPKKVAEPIADKAIGKLEWYIGPDQQEVLYHESDLIEDAQRILDWGPEMQWRCPDKRSARNIGCIMQMDRKSLYDYVKGALGMG